MNFVQPPNCFPQKEGLTKDARLVPDLKKKGLGQSLTLSPVLQSVSEAVTSSRVKWQIAGGRAFYLVLDAHPLLPGSQHPTASAGRSHPAFVLIPPSVKNVSNNAATYLKAVQELITISKVL